MHKEYAGIPLTDGHVGFEEPRVYPVRPDTMPDAHLMNLGKIAVENQEPAEAIPEVGLDQSKSYYPGHEPYQPLTAEERENGLSGVGNARTRLRKDK